MEESSKYEVYIKLDSNNNVTAVNSSVFIDDVTDWIKIDEGESEKYAHAQNNYLEKSVIDEAGIYRYVYSDGIVREKTTDEIQNEKGSIKIPLTETELLKRQIEALSSENEFLSDCLVEMAQVVYA